MDLQRVTSQGVLHDSELLSVSDGLGTSWKRFGVSLGFKWPEMQRLESQHRDCVMEACMSMLTTWRKQQSTETNQVDVMIKLLDEHRFSAVANRLRLDVYSEGVLTDQDFQLISKRIGADWENVALCLGLSWDEIESIDAESRGHGLKVCMKMLTRWRTQQSRDINQLDVMCRILNEQDFTDVAEQLKAEHASKKLCVFQA